MPADAPGPVDHAAALGTEPVGRLLWRNCTQTTASVGIYGVYALTNAWFVEHGVGTTAMAAVNLVAPILLVMGAVSTTVGVGGASLVSRSLGAGDPAYAARAAGTAFVLFWATAITTTVVGLVALGPLLTVLGAVGDTRAVAREYATHDLLVFPSRYEGFGMVFLEAMAAGLPVVATPVGGVVDIVRDGQNGVMVPVGDPDALARAVLELWRDPERRARIGAAAHLTARSYAWRDVARQTVRCYEAASGLVQV